MNQGPELLRAPVKKIVGVLGGWDLLPRPHSGNILPGPLAGERTRCHNQPPLSAL